MPRRSPRPAEPNFDAVARLYRWAEYLTLGPLLQQTRTCLLHRLASCRQALLLGDGDGRFLAQLLLRYPAIHAMAIDTSAVMLRLLRARIRRAAANMEQRLTVLHGSALEAAVPPGTDLVVTHFFLDCLPQTEVDTLIRRVAASLQPGSLWLVSDFAIPAQPVLRSAARLYVRALYLAFRLLTGLRVRALPDPQTAFARNGFRRLTRHNKILGLLYSELWVLESNAEPMLHNPSAAGFIHKPMESLEAMELPEPIQEPAADIEDTGRRYPDAVPNGLPDAVPDPEPPVPSLPEPDPGVFHHHPGTSPHSTNEAQHVPGKPF